MLKQHETTNLLRQSYSQSHDLIDIEKNLLTLMLNIDNMFRLSQTCDIINIYQEIPGIHTFKYFFAKCCTIKMF